MSFIFTRSLVDILGGSFLAEDPQAPWPGLQSQEDWSKSISRIKEMLSHDDGALMTFSAMEALDLLLQEYTPLMVSHTPSSDSTSTESVSSSQEKVTRKRKRCRLNRVSIVQQLHTKKTSLGKLIEEYQRRRDNGLF
jgi:hypothetical protein